MNLDRYIITAEYTSCCFCNKPRFPSSKSYPLRPRWNFRKAAREYASQHGIYNLFFNKASTHSAVGRADIPCQHCDKQYVRIEWAFEPES